MTEIMVFIPHQLWYRSQKNDPTKLEDTKRSKIFFLEKKYETKWFNPFFNHCASTTKNLWALMNKMCELYNEKSVDLAWKLFTHQNVFFWMSRFFLLLFLSLSHHPSVVSCFFFLSYSPQCWCTAAVFATFLHRVGFAIFQLPLKSTCHVMSCTKKFHLFSFFVL